MGNRAFKKRKESVKAIIINSDVYQDLLPQNVVSSQEYSNFLIISQIL